MAANKKFAGPMLPQGTGTPYLSIFDGADHAIIDPLTGLNIGELMESFTYVYDEEDDDGGEVFIKCNNPALPAHSKLKFDMPLHLQWGWIYPDGDNYYGPVRRVIIIGKEVSFTADGIEMKIKFSSASILTKNTPSNYDGQDKGFLKYLEYLFKGSPVQVEMYDYSNEIEQETYVIAKKLYYTSEVPEEERGEYDKKNLFGNDGHKYVDDPRYKNKVVTPHYKPSIKSYTQFPQTPTYYYNETAVKILQYTPENQELLNNFPTEYQLLHYNGKYHRNVLIVGTDKNVRKQIESLVKGLPNGPWYVDGRDNKLIIHNKKVNLPYFREYYYYGGNGELLEFSVNTEFIGNGSSSSKNTEVNIDTGELEVQTIQILKDPDAPVSPDAYIAWESLDRYQDWELDGNLLVEAQKEHHRKLAAIYNAHQNNYFAGQGDDDVLKQYFGGAPTPVTPPPQSNIGTVQDAAAAEGLTVEEYLNKQINNPANKHRIGYLYTQSGAYQVKPGDTQILNAESQPYASISDINNVIDNILTGQYPITEAEYKAYIEVLKKKFEAFLQEDVTEEMIEEAFRGVNKVPDFLFKRRIWVQVNPDNLKGLHRGEEKEEDNLRPEARITYPLANGDMGNGLGGEWGYGYLTKLADSTGEVRNIYYTYNDNSMYSANPEHGERIVHSYEVLITLEVPVNGVRILAGFDPANIEYVEGNDIKLSVDGHETARALIIGNPSIESSMNLMIRNVSKLYSGGWYTKKVQHKMSISSGYLCEIDFVVRQTPYKTVITKGSVTMKGLLTKIYEMAKASVKSGEFENRAHIESTINSTLSPFQSHLVEVNSEDPSKPLTVYSSEQPFNVNQSTDANGTPQAPSKTITSINTGDGKSN